MIGSSCSLLDCMMEASQGAAAACPLLFSLCLVDPSDPIVANHSVPSELLSDFCDVERTAAFVGDLRRRFPGSRFVIHTGEVVPDLQRAGLGHLGPDLSFASYSFDELEGNVPAAAPPPIMVLEPAEGSGKQLIGCFVSAEKAPGTGQRSGTIRSYREAASSTSRGSSQAQTPLSSAKASAPSYCDSPSHAVLLEPHAVSFIFWDHMWPKLQEMGWTKEHGSRPNDRFFFPPGFVQKKRRQKRVRVDYFDSAKQVVAKVMELAREEEGGGGTELLSFLSEMAALTKQKLKTQRKRQGGRSPKKPPMTPVSPTFWSTRWPLLESKGWTVKKGRSDEQHVFLSPRAPRRSKSFTGISSLLKSKDARKASADEEVVHERTPLVYHVEYDDGMEDDIDEQQLAELGGAFHKREASTALKHPRKRRRGAESVEDAPLPVKTFSPHLWSIATMRFSSMWAHVGLETVVATKVSMPVHALALALQSLLHDMELKNKEIGFRCWESSELACDNSCEV
jgi:hypothetical protein